MKSFRPWVQFSPPSDNETHSDFISFAECVIAVNEFFLKRDQEELRAFARDTQEELLQPYQGTDLPEVQESLQSYVNEACTDPDHVRIDSRLEDLSTEELAVQLQSFLNTLSERALKGDKDAIARMVAVARQATFDLSLLEKTQPETIRAAAKSFASWPILLPGDERAAISETKRALELGIGDQFAAFRSKFHQLNGADDHRPNRLWAQKAVRTVELTKCRLAYANGKGAFQPGVLLECGIFLEPFPSWLHKDRMPVKPFSRSALTEWKTIVREIIRSDCPDFHLHEDWNNQRRTLEQSGRSSRGVLQNAILDDICSALKGLAPRD